MADNVTLPAASGNVAADEVTFSGDTTKVQLFRPVHVEGSEGSKTQYGITGQQGVFVVSRKDLQRISVTSAGLTTATTTYSIGDQTGTLFTLADAARVSGGSGMIVGIVLIDASDVIGTMDVAFFRSSATLAADNAAFAISDADALNLVAIVQLAGAFDITNNRVAQAFNLAVPYDCSDTSLYAALITRTANAVYAGGVGSLQLITYVERN
jgi:hypothetical protein